ncbi:hypothetical protein P4626_18565, partial [Halalkalibacterium halodurans]|uniref:hypothetical protein n=1 Tax=Halalkalibacterium halodurans TaxID=86665 RepID=UPI002E1FB9B3|nr:hypothetical protein [Halalkalibacterium halodurans]
RAPSRHFERISKGAASKDRLLRQLHFCVDLCSLVPSSDRRKLLREKQQRKIAESGVLEEAGACPRKASAKSSF